MRQFFFFLFAFIAAFAGNLYAQSGIGNNSVMVSTTTDGNVAWSANIDGHNRKGYIDNSSLDICSHKQVDEEVIIPTTTYTYPNQFTDVLFFNGDGVNTYSVTIKDSKGNVIATKQSTEDYSLDISAYADDTYTLLIKRGENGKEYIRKIVKQ